MNEHFTLRQTIELALISGLVSLVLAIIGGVITYLTARSNFGRELAKIREQIKAQQEAEEQGKIAELRQRYLTPLRYYAYTLSKRFTELELKFQSGESSKVRQWFKSIKDHVADDQRMQNYGVWSCYEGIFSLTTLYYTCSYFQCARELRFNMPFRGNRPQYSEQLDFRLARVTQAFHWDGEQNGIWDALQEVIGERFTASGSRMTYGEMCTEHDCQDQFRRAPFLRPLDFYWSQLDPERTQEIKASLDELVAFLDSHDPQTMGVVKAEGASAD
jgi:hypothetical protein